MQWTTTIMVAVATLGEFPREHLRRLSLFCRRNVARDAKCVSPRFVRILLLLLFFVVLLLLLLCWLLVGVHTRLFARIAVVRRAPRQRGFSRCAIADDSARTRVCASRVIVTTAATTLSTRSKRLSTTNGTRMPKATPTRAKPPTR